MFARQSQVELVFAERGFDDLRTQPVVGSFSRARAVKMLLAGTGLRSGYGPANSVIVLGANVSAKTSDVNFDDNNPESSPRHMGKSWLQTRGFAMPKARLRS